MNERFVYDVDMGVSLTTSEIDETISWIESVFTTDFVPLSLAEAVTRGGFENGKEITESSLSLSSKAFPENPLKKEMMSFLFCYMYDTRDAAEGVESESPFRVINRVLFDFGPTNIQRLSPFLWGLLVALRSLRRVKFECLYRRFTKRYKWKQGDARVLRCFLSMSLKKDIGRQFFLDADGKECGTLMQGENLFGYDVSEFSRHPEEEEVILEPFQIVVAKEVSDYGSAINVIVEGKTSRFILQDKVVISEKISHVDYLNMKGIMSHGEGKHVDAFKLFNQAAELGSQVAKMNMMTFLLSCWNSSEQDVCVFDDSLNQDIPKGTNDSAFLNNIRSSLDVKQLIFSVGDIEKDDIERMRGMRNDRFAHPGRLNMKGLFRFISFFSLFHYSRGIKWKC